MLYEAKIYQNILGNLNHQVDKMLWNDGVVKLNKEESYCKFAYQLMLKKRLLAVKFRSQELEKVENDCKQKEKLRAYSMISC